MYDIVIDRTAGFVAIRFNGLISVVERGRALEETVVVLAESGYRQVLVDFSGADFAIDDFDSSNTLASRLAFNAMLRTCRIAYLTEPGARINPIVDALADARGFSFRRFDERCRAMQWLLLGIDHHPMSEQNPSAPQTRWDGMHPSEMTRSAA